MDYYIVEYIKQKMAELDIINYDIEPHLVSVVKSTSEIVKYSDNKYFLLVNAFSEGALTGKVTSDIEALEINSITMNTEYYKNRLFKNNLRITNDSTSETMYVEFLIITPSIC